MRVHLSINLHQQQRTTNSFQRFTLKAFFTYSASSFDSAFFEEQKRMRLCQTQQAYDRSARRSFFDLFDGLSRLSGLGPGAGRGPYTKELSTVANSIIS